MCDDDEVWQVAGHRRRRHRPGSETSKPKIHRRVGQNLSHPTSSTNNINSNNSNSTTTINTTTATTTANNSSTLSNANSTGSSTVRGAHRGKKNRTANSGYSYSTKAGRQQQQQQPGQQQADNREELVRTELLKLEQLKALLMETALWQRLVEGLESIFPQLGLAFPPPEIKSRQVLANALSRSKEEALLGGRGGGAVGVGRDSQTAESAQSGGSSEQQQQEEEEEEEEEQQQLQQQQQQQQLHQHQHQHQHHHHHQVLSELVCYGIGNFTESHSSRYQLALALCLRDLLLPASNNSAPDPTTTARGASKTSGTEGGICTAVAQNADAFELRCSDGTEPSQAGRSDDHSQIADRSEERSEKSECSEERSEKAERAEEPSEIAERPEKRAEKVEPGQGVSTSAPEILVFDPVMGDAEKSILAALRCGVLENEEGKRSCYGVEGGMEERRGGGCCCGLEGGVGKGSGDENEEGERRCCGVEGGAGEGGGDGFCCGVEGGAGKGGVDGDIDEGRRRRRPTLFFMPHCPQRLYSNLLWANWSSSGLGSIVILGNKLSSYRDRTLSATALSDPTNSILRSGPLLEDFDLVPYQGTDRKTRWKRDVERLPRLEKAFNDLTLSYSSAAARASPAGVAALRDRPQEFVEEVDGELITGRVGSH